MLKTYERALDDVPIADLKVALLDTLRSVAYWPTPGHIRGKLDDLRSKREYYEEPKAKPPHGCPDCDGTTWVPVTLQAPSNRTALRSGHVLRLHIEGTGSGKGEAAKG